MQGKHTLTGLVLLGALAAAQLAPVAGAAPQGGEPVTQGQHLQIVAEPLSAQEQADILFMREEENLARDVYLYQFDLWSYPVFDNIAASEQRHMDSMAELIDSYALVDPVVDDSAGAFTDPGLASLYIELTTRGQASLLEALRVGAFIEETDMRDIRTAIDNAAHADIVQTYENLLRGSRNHLRAFVRTLESMGVVYEAQVLTQSEVDEIVDSPTERGATGGTSVSTAP